MSSPWSFPIFFFFWHAERRRKKVRLGKCCVRSSGNTVKILLPGDKMNTDISTFIVKLLLSTAASCKIQNVIRFLRMKKVTPIACENCITLRISQSAAVLSGSSMMNVLMSAFASSPANKIFIVLPELPTQHFSGLTFFLHRSACQEK